MASASSTWWVDPFGVDLLFQRLCLLAGHLHFAVPAIGGHRTSGPEIEARRIRVGGEGRLRQSEQVGGGVVAGELAQRYGVLATLHDEVAVFCDRRSGITGRIHFRRCRHSQELVDDQPAQWVSLARNLFGQRTGQHTGGPHSRRGRDDFPVGESYLGVGDLGDRGAEPDFDPECVEGCDDLRSRTVAELLTHVLRAVNQHDPRAPWVRAGQLG